MGVIEVDLHTQPRGCTDHSLVKLKKVLKSASRAGKVKVIADINIVPLTAVELIAK